MSSNEKVKQSQDPALTSENIRSKPRTDLLASRNAQSSRESEMEVAGESVLGLNPSSSSVSVSCDGYNK